MSRPLVLLFALALGACGGLPDFEAAEPLACRALPGVECTSYDESSCGWVRVDPVAGAREDIVSADGTRFVAPAGECLLIAAKESGRLVPPGTHPCDVEALGSTCRVLMPSESVEMFKQIGTRDPARASDWRSAESCRLTCDELNAGHL